MHKFSGNKRKIICTRADVAAFREVFPASNLRDRAYWFEFDEAGDLVDCNVTEHDDGAGASALADDCRQFYQYGRKPDWL